MRKISKKTLILSALIVFFAVLSVVFYLKYAGLKWEIHYQNSIPDIELIDYMSFDKRTGWATGSISGFVAFKNPNDQPKTAKQYYVIEALNFPDDNSNQVFVYDDIMVLEHLSPRSLGKTVLVVTNDSGDTLTLEDEYGNIFKIDKTTKEVVVFDKTGDSVYLIADDQDYRDFMRKFLEAKK